MKRYSIFLLLISFLLFAEALAMKPSEETLAPSEASLAQRIKRSAEHSREFALSKDTGNFLLFVLSAGFLLCLPKHLSKTSTDNFFDKTVKFPRINLFEPIFGNASWAKPLYYELLTLLAGYVCLKTGKPYLEKLKQS